jgi:tetratricopeptide (TPR) repeat protein
MKIFKYSLFFLLFTVFFSTEKIHADTSESNTFLQMGHKKKNAGDLDGAIEFYKKALVTAPHFETAKLSLEDAINEKNLLLFSKNIPGNCQTATTNFDQTLKCAQQYFIMGSQPINPMIIKDLSTWISDGGDQVVAINLLDAQTSNKYFHNLYKIKENGKYFAVEVPPSSKEDRSFRYTVEGVTDNGIFVIQTTDWGDGGTGIFPNLLFVRIRKGMGFGDVKNGGLSLNRQRILVEKLGELPLGDRVRAIITIQGNTIRIDSEQGLPPYKKNTEKIVLSVEEK